MCKKIVNIRPLDSQKDTRIEFSNYSSILFSLHAVGIVEKAQ